MTVYNFKGPKGETITVEGDGTEDEAWAAAKEQLDQNITDEWDKRSQWSKFGGALSDMASAGIHGVTMGLDDKASAALHSALSSVIINGQPITGDNMSYQDALAKEEQNTYERQTRMNHVMDHSSDVFEGLGSMAMPAGMLAKGVGATGKLGTVARAGADVLENAGYGTLGALAQGQDPNVGAAVGAGGTVLGPALKGLTKFGVASGARGGGAVAGAALGAPLGHAGTYGGISLGGHYGGKIGRAFNSGIDRVADSNPGRDVLASLSAAPGRLYGAVSDWWNR